MNIIQQMSVDLNDELTFRITKVNLGVKWMIYIRYENTINFIV